MWNCVEGSVTQLVRTRVRARGSRVDVKITGHATGYRTLQPRVLPLSASTVRRHDVQYIFALTSQRVSLAQDLTEPHACRLLSKTTVTAQRLEVGLRLSVKEVVSRVARQQKSKRTAIRGFQGEVL